MSAQDNGGPAFPVADPFVFSPCNESEAKALAHGMTLRDYFAAEAMKMKFGETGSSMTKDRMAEECYDMADAMLNARDK